MPEVKAPYNFVPLNKKVVSADWADLISHDLPINNSVSGHIQVEIEAHSPIFIGGSTSKIPGTGFNQTFFPEFNGKYFVPGSSLKGEIANVLEILSFSKLRFFNDHKFSQRDWNNSNIYDKTAFAKVKGGWLRKTDEGFQIRYNTRNPGRIEHKYINQEVENFFGGKPDALGMVYQANSDQHKSAIFKYQKAGLLNNGTINFQTESFEEIDKDRFGKTFFKRSSIVNNQNLGKVVVTGQSSKRNDHDRKGKRYEFIFWENPSKQKIINLNSTFLNDEEYFHEKVKDFFFGQNDDNQNSYSHDWSYWKKALGNGYEVPVFLTLDDGLSHFGLSMLYKIPFEKSISETLPPDHLNDTKKDFTYCLFGDIENEKLKGRVHFSHLFSDNAVKLQETPLHIVLNSPKASYYPFYVEQNNVAVNGDINGNYLTYNDGTISGRKRYPIRRSNSPELQGNQAEPGKLTSNINPLKEGAVFRGKVHFHNLLPVEVGALLSALSFHNQPDCFHSIGQAKSLGLGKCKIKIRAFAVDGLNFRKEQYLSQFEKFMTSKVSNWLGSDQLKELVALATPTSDEKLKYMDLEDFAKLKDTERGRKSAQALPRFSTFVNKSVSIVSQKGDSMELSTPSLDFDLLSREVKTDVKDRINQLLSEIERSQREIKLEEWRKRDEELKEQEEKSRLQRAENALEEGMNSLNLQKKRHFGDFYKEIDKWLKRTQLNQIPEGEFDSFFIELKDFALKNNKTKDEFLSDRFKQKLREKVGESKGNEWFELIKSEIK